MSHHPGQLSLVVHVGQDLPCEINVTSGKSKGVDDRAIDDVEMPLQFGTMREDGQLLPDLIEVTLQIGVFHPSELRQHLGMGFSSVCDLLTL